MAGFYVILLALVSGLWATRGITVSLWLDETATASASTRSLSQLLHLLTREDPALATYYVFMHAWTSTFGDSEVILRLPSLFAVMASIVLMGAIGHRLGGSLGAVAAATLLAIWPHFVGVYAVEARNYAPVVVLVIAAALCALEIRAGRGGRALVVLWTALAAATIAVDVLAAPAVVPQLLWLLVGRPVGERRRLIPAFIVVLVISAGALFMAHRGSELQNWIPAKHLTDYAKGAVALITVGGIVLVLASIPGLILFRRVIEPQVRRRTLFDIGVAVCWTVLPFLAIIAYSILLSPSFITRYYLAAAPGASLAVALIVTASWRGLVSSRSRLTREPLERRLARVGTILLTCATVIAFAVPVALHDFDFATYENPRAAAQFIERNELPGDGIVYAPTYAQVNLDWYLRGGSSTHLEAPRDLLAQPRESAQSAGSLWTPTLSSSVPTKTLLSGVDRVWIAGYSGSIAWRPVRDAGSPIAHEIERCWTASSKLVPNNKDFIFVQLWTRPNGTPAPGCTI